MGTTIDSYAEEIKDKVAGRLGSGFEVDVIKVRKNNGRTLTGLTVRREKENVSPTIYLDGYFEDGKRDVADEIAAICFKPSPFKDSDIVQKLTEESFARRHICYRLINWDRNSELLKDTPHRDFLDLAIVYFLSVDVGTETHGSILVKDSMMRSWGMDEEELFEIAKRNTPVLFHYESGRLSDVIKELSGDFTIGDGRADLRILTNREKLNGASAILYDGVLEREAKEAGGDIYVIPSSVHEVLLVKKDEGMDASDIASMIKDINETMVSPEEELSDSLYCYSSESGLEIVKTGEEKGEGDPYE